MKQALVGGGRTGSQTTAGVEKGTFTSSNWSKHLVGVGDTSITHPCIAGGNVKWYSHYRNSLAVTCKSEYAVTHNAPNGHLGCFARFRCSQ